MDNAASTVYIRSRRSGSPALKACPCGLVEAMTFGQAKEWEQWKLHQLGDGIVALQSYHGKFLSAKSDFSVIADAEKIDDWENGRLPSLIMDSYRSILILVGFSCATI